MNRYIKRIIELGWSPLDDFNIIDSGWSNVIVEVNQQQVFRFPRQLAPQFKVEKAFLAQFAPISPLKVPNPEPSPNDIMTYPRIDGERFDPAKFRRLNPADQDRIIRQLSEFLTTMHNFNFEHPDLSTAPYGGADFWQDLWPLAEAKLSKSARANAEKYFVEMIDRVERVPFNPSIVHADLGTNNTLVDFTRAEITGIIDFSDMRWGDPAADFASFFSHFGRAFVQKLIDGYQRPIESNFWPRIEFHRKRKLFFIAYFAQNYGFQKQLPWVVDRIEKEFIEESANQQANLF